jgi:WXG100 family type VII secretion target
MTDRIEVDPAMLRDRAARLRAASQRIRQQFTSVEAQMRGLPPSLFEGQAAAYNHQEYLRLSRYLLQTVTILDRFANDLDAAANEFSEVDKRLTRGGGRGGNQTVNRGAIDPALNRDKQLDQITPDGALVPAYRLDLNNPLADPQELVKQIPNAGGRPVIFVIHGYTGSDENFRTDIGNMAQWYGEKYKGLPADQLPIIVAVDWRAELVPHEGVVQQGVNYAGFAGVEAMSKASGMKLGQVMELYQKDNPNSNLGITAHSMGTVVGAYAVQTSDVHLRGFLAIQGAADADEIRPGGSLSALVDPSRVEVFYNTWSGRDLVIRVGEAAAHTTITPDLKDVLLGPALNRGMKLGEVIWEGGSDGIGYQGIISKDPGQVPSHIINYDIGLHGGGHFTFNPTNDAVGKVTEDYMKLFLGGDD